MLLSHTLVIIRVRRKSEDMGLISTPAIEFLDFSHGRMSIFYNLKN
jgi:hypothetical protein